MNNILQSCHFKNACFTLLLLQVKKKVKNWNCLKSYNWHCKYIFLPPLLDGMQILRGFKKHLRYTGLNVWITLVTVFWKEIFINGPKRCSGRKGFWSVFRNNSRWDVEVRSLGPVESIWDSFFNLEIEECHLYVSSFVL